MTSIHKLMILFIFNSGNCGMELHPQEVISDISITCTKCPPGWGVVQKCNMYKDTVCQKCEQRKTYSSTKSSKNPCLPCSRCGVGLYTAKYCTRFSDTFCDECINYINNKNFTRKNDFEDKCRYTML